MNLTWARLALIVFILGGRVHNSYAWNFIQDPNTFELYYISREDQTLKPLDPSKLSFLQQKQSYTSLELALRQELQTIADTLQTGGIASPNCRVNVITRSIEIRTSAGWKRAQTVPFTSLSADLETEFQKFLEKLRVTPQRTRRFYFDPKDRSFYKRSESTGRWEKVTHVSLLNDTAQKREFEILANRVKAFDFQMKSIYSRFSEVFSKVSADQNTNSKPTTTANLNMEIDSESKHPEMDLTDSEECVEFDHSQLMGPTRNQGPHSMCWAFANAALLEESACLDNEFCGQQVSVFDISREKDLYTSTGPAFDFFSDKQWKFATLDEAHFAPPLALEKFTERDFGFCTEKQSPYVPLCDRFNNPNCLINKLRAVWVTVQSDPQASLSCVQTPLGPLVNSPSAIGLSINELSKAFPDLWPRVSNQEELLTKLRPIGLKTVSDALTARTFSDFLQRLLIPATCYENRQILKKDLKVDHLTFGTPIAGWPPALQHTPEAVTQKEKLRSFILDSFKKGRSVGLGICTKVLNSRLQTQLGLQSGPVGDNSCGGHALVANKMRSVKDPLTGKTECKITLKNSWGSPAPFHGEFNLIDILDSTILTYGFREKAQ